MPAYFPGQLFLSLHLLANMAFGSSKLPWSPTQGSGRTVFQLRLKWLGASIFLVPFHFMSDTTDGMSQMTKGPVFPPPRFPPLPFFPPLPCPPLLLSLLDWGQDRTSDLQEQVQLALVLAGYSKAKAPSISPFYSWED